MSLKTELNPFKIKFLKSMNPFPIINRWYHSLPKPLRTDNRFGIVVSGDGLP